ncbi:cadherin-like domain-containing protein [Hymenobacter negativus]|uniref:Cadherin-like domain-containing protein n=1 Tax=Hymenobacter negativus TaxID=2795026 RepID=A0ABS3QAI7_9BACT|nr:cadherin-like domain-containing protein [Hymenobacter negativus]MBO2008270.1 cadherin-like domain-containing protein [Hymenobacter negativus]
MKIQLLFRRMALLVPLLCLSMMVQASHFRFGSITYQTTGGNNLTAQIRVTEAWRDDAYGAPPVLGQVVTVDGALDFGDGNAVSIPLTVTTVGAGYFYGEYVTSHTYAAAGNYTVSTSTCCRISTLENNADGDFYFSTRVVAGSANDSPVSTLLPIINLPVNQAGASYMVPSSDPNGNTLTYSAATSADLGNIDFTNAPGMTVNPSTGQVSFSTVGKTVGQLYNAVVKVSDGSTSIILDHIIQISATASNAAPVFTAPTPPNGTVYTVTAGQLVTFGVRATDSDAGDNVNLQAVGVPSGASTAPALPTSGNPVQTTFSFTPTAAQVGNNYVISFVAQDNSAQTTTTSVTIQVQANPCNPNANTPTAATDNFTASCGPITVTQAQLLANDTSPNGTFLVVGSVSGGTNGTVVDNGDGTYTFTPNPGYVGPASFTYLVQSAGPIFPAPATGHYYELVGAPGLCWDAAKMAAAARTYAGMTGYLATLTSAAEVNAVKNRNPGQFWFGAADDVTEGTWMWKTGPEIGQTFYASGATLPGQYSNWSTNEPDDYKNIWRPIGEDYAQMFGASGLWNDLDNCATGANVVGYIVEYGGLEACTPVLYATGTVNINVTNTGNGTPSIVANPDAFSTSAGAPVTVTAAQLMGNDTDSQGRSLRISSVSGGTNGTVVDNGNNTYTFTPAGGYTGPATFNYLLQLAGPVFASATTGHYYEFVADANLCWTAAKAAAAARTYNGLQGYLATITSASENALLKGRNPNNVWFGAADDLVEGEWRWKTGPEAGQLFFVGTGMAGATQPGQYSNWSGGEPNDDKNTFRPGGEDYGHMYGSSGLWNDLSDCAGGSATAGYFVEYGGLESCTPVLFSTGTVTVTVGPTAARSTGSTKVTASIEAAPNPSNGQFKVHLVAANEAKTKVDLFDLQGRYISTVFEGAMTAGEQREVDVNQPELATGLYMVRMQNGGNVKYVRVAVQK